MKKGMFVFSIFMVVAMLAACGTPATPTPATAAPATAAPATAAPATEPPAPALPAKVTVAIPGDPSNLGPFVGMSLGRIGVLTSMYEYLFYLIGPDATPYVAKSFEKVADKTYVSTFITS